MGTLEWITQVKEKETGVSQTAVPTNLEEALLQLNEYIDSQLPVTYEVDFIPVCFDVTKDEEKVFMGGEFGNIGVYNLSSKKMTKDIELTSKSILSVILASDDSVGVVVTESNLVYVLEFPSFYLRKILTCQTGPVMVNLNYLKDSIYLSSCTAEIKLIELEKFDEVVIPCEEQVDCLNVCDDGSLIAVGGPSGKVQLIHAETQRTLQATEPRDCAVESLLFSHFRRILAVAYSDFSVIVYNVDGKLSIKHHLTEHKGKVTGLAFTNKGRYLITGGRDFKIMVLDTKIEGLPFFLDLFEQPVLHFRTSPDSTKLYFSQHLNRLMVWKIPSLSKNARYRKHSEKVSCVLFIPGGFELISLGEDGLAIIWDYRNNVEAETIELSGKLITGVVSKKATFAIIANDEPSLIRLSLNTYRSYNFELNSQVNAIHLNEVEDLLALSDNFFRILIYDCVTMERKYVIKGHTGLVNGLKFVYSDSTLITCSNDMTLVKWEIKVCSKVSTMTGHKAPVKCLVVTPDEQLVFSGDGNSEIHVWNLDYDVWVQTITVDPSPQGIISITLSGDVSYLVILQDTKVSFMQYSNLSILFQKDSEFSVSSLAFDVGEKFFALAEENTVFVEENPLNAESVKVVGKKQGSPHKFMNYVREIQGKGGLSQYDTTFNHWLFTPYRLGIAHILAYSNKNNTLAEAFAETSNKLSFCSTVNGENPISISVSMDHGSCIELCLKFMKTEYFNGNNRAFMPLSNCLTELTLLDIPGIPKLYDLIYRRSDALHLPSFAVEELTCLPSLFKSQNIIINIETLLPAELRASHGESIVFFGSLCPFNLEAGTNDSVAFLESLLECPYQEIFRAKVIGVILRDKWEYVKNAINFQGSIYIVYLIQLSFYTVMFRDSDLFLAALFFSHLLLFFYEVFQIATDFVEYWFDFWNLLDQARGLAFSIFAFLKWQGYYDPTFLLVANMFSWVRGISYFRMFEGTRSMVRLISEVINDMQVFFIILFYSTLAFTFIYYINEGAMSFPMYLTMSYRLDLADFSTDEYQGFDWVIFFLATVINPLVMMNLLISIMGTTYERVQEGNDIANFQELTGMILEIEKLMFWKKNQTKQNFVQQCIKALEMEAEESNKVNDRLKLIRKQISTIEGDLNVIQEDLNFDMNLDLDALNQACGEAGMINEVKNSEQFIAANEEMVQKLLEKVNMMSYS